MSRSLDPQTLTWTALLAKWTDFARASLSLPDTDDGDRLRKAVPSIINLQAVTFALNDLEYIPNQERPLARDKAEIIITNAAAELDSIYRGCDMPHELVEVCTEARLSLDRAIYVGARELVWLGPGVFTMPEVDVPEQAENRSTTLAMMMPGTLVMPGEPVAWWTGDLEINVDGCVIHHPKLPRQVYRQINEQGQITGDVIAAIDDDLPSGMPLLVPLYIDGQPAGHFTMEADAWLQRQRGALASEVIAVEDRTGERPADAVAGAGGDQAGCSAAAARSSDD